MLADAALSRGEHAGLSRMAVLIPEIFADLSNGPIFEGSRGKGGKKSVANAEVCKTIYTLRG